ncbi:uncharacterized protein RCO7_04228 [Rhynchosporium graminicola]|uniref:Uncharacterized protein n=1 Tax=Rhynchosporium graminicola TaxID=2792576 RepID=A0A1E1LRG7_9HELO|nr:uncharacterized protein RCO7_04228 [Rhynchosporium commune]
MADMPAMSSPVNSATGITPQPDRQNSKSSNTMVFDITQKIKAISEQHIQNMDGKPEKADSEEQHENIVLKTHTQEDDDVTKCKTLDQLRSTNQGMVPTTDKEQAGKRGKATSTQSSAVVSANEIEAIMTTGRPANTTFRTAQRASNGSDRITPCSTQPIASPEETVLKRKKEQQKQQDPPNRNATSYMTTPDSHPLQGLRCTSHPSAHTAVVTEAPKATEGMVYSRPASVDVDGTPEFHPGMDHSHRPPQRMYQRVVYQSCASSAAGLDMN